MSNYTMMIQFNIWTMVIKPLLAEPFLSEPCCILKWWQYWRSWHCWQIHSLQRLSLPCFNIYDNSQDNPTDLSPCSLYVWLSLIILLYPKSQNFIFWTLSSWTNFYMQIAEILLVKCHCLFSFFLDNQTWFVGGKC